MSSPEVIGKVVQSLVELAHLFLKTLEEIGLDYEPPRVVLQLVPEI